MDLLGEFKGLWILYGESASGRVKDAANSPECVISNGRVRFVYSVNQEIVEHVGEIDESGDVHPRCCDRFDCLHLGLRISRCEKPPPIGHRNLGIEFGECVANAAVSGGRTLNHSEFLQQELG